MACLLAARGDSVAAMRELQAVLDAQTKTLGRDHPGALATHLALQELTSGIIGTADLQ